MWIKATEGLRQSGGPLSGSAHSRARNIPLPSRTFYGGPDTPTASVRVQGIIAYQPTADLFSHPRAELLICTSYTHDCYDST